MKNEIEYNPHWFVEEVNRTEHMQRISNVLDIKEYMLRVHDVLNRKDFQFKNETYTTAKIILNTLKSIINFHTSYVIGNPISISGEPDTVKEFNKVYKRGVYSKTDYQIVNDLYTYGNAFEYVYMKDGVISSKVIANEDAYPVYDEKSNYVAFIEHWQDFETGHDNYIVYNNSFVQEYVDNKLVRTSNNLTGLPIHYSMMDKTAYNFFGDSMMNDLMPIMNQIEALLSKLDDAITTLSLNPIGVSDGQRIDDSIPKDIVGATINLDEGGSFKWVNAQMDYQNIKLLLDSLVQQLYAVAGVPASVIGQGNIANVSEVSLKLLFSQTDNKAKQTIEVLKEGFFKRFAYIKTLLILKGVLVSKRDFETLDITFNVNRPVDTQNLINELKVQYDMGAISKQTVIDISPYTTDTALELQRIEAENCQSDE